MDTRYSVSLQLDWRTWIVGWTTDFLDCGIFQISVGPCTLNATWPTDRWLPASLQPAVYRLAEWLRPLSI